MCYGFIKSIWFIYWQNDSNHQKMLLEERCQWTGCHLVSSLKHLFPCSRQYCSTWLSAALCKMAWIHTLVTNGYVRKKDQHSSMNKRAIKAPRRRLMFRRWHCKLVSLSLLGDVQRTEEKHGSKEEMEAAGGEVGSKADEDNACSTSVNKRQSWGDWEGWFLGQYYKFLHFLDKTGPRRCKWDTRRMPASNDHGRGCRSNLQAPRNWQNSAIFSNFYLQVTIKH